MRNKFTGPAGFLSGLLLICVLFPAAHGQPISDSLLQVIAPLPDALLSNEGKVVDSSPGWENVRRDEVLDLFRSHVYGGVPEAEYFITYEVRTLDKHALDGKAVMREVDLIVNTREGEHVFTMLLFLPAGITEAAPLFVGLNFNGNHTVFPAEEIRITSSWVESKAFMGTTENKALEQNRGASASRWPVEMILERGYGLATIYYGDIDPDYDDGFKNGIQGFLEGKEGERKTDSWGAISAWAWGLSRAMDYFETDLAIDHHRVAVIGHSRLGKTSLWAGAQDERFAMVVSNNSGCGGAALSRRPFGERVSDINRRFPHWFAEKFHGYDDNEAACPVDQHMLLALMAPRPLYVASASKDEWADPRGEYLSLFLSGEVYSLYGIDVLEDELSPALNKARWKGRQGYHIRDGKHDITTFDWEKYLDFADQQVN